VGQAKTKIASSEAAGASTNNSSSKTNTAGTGSAFLTSTSNADGSKIITLPSGVIVTGVDDMSSDKVIKTISTRILEMNGLPFYIEEGGVVKEIIAVLKDGKIVLDEKGNPVFEKIVKGKIGDKKFALQKVNDRKPASVTVDYADMKRIEEERLKKERAAEYLKLKDLSNKALKKGTK
jgi:hypothetical protein